jgi:ABC-type multidrug transport system fused ATPase/permease subunit
MDNERLKALFSATSVVRTRAESRRSLLGTGLLKRVPRPPLSGLSLIDALLIAAEELGREAEREQLLSALPQNGNDLNPIAAQLALSRIELHGEWQNEGHAFNRSSTYPCIVALKSGGYIIVLESGAKNDLRVRAAGYHGVYPAEGLKDQAGSAFLPVCTMATAVVRSTQGKVSVKSGYVSALRNIWTLEPFKTDVSLKTLLFSLAVNLLCVTALLAVVFGVSTVGQGSLVTIPISAAISTLYLWLMNHWRKQRSGQIAPSLYSAMRGVFFRGSLLRQTLGLENHAQMARDSVARFLDAIRTPCIDLPVGILAAVLTYIKSPAWMIEMYIPAMLLLGYAVVKANATRRHAKDLVRLCRAIRFSAQADMTRLRGDMALDHATVTSDDSRPLLDHVTIRIRAGERIAITGDMSSGKTMLLKALGGVVALDDGRRYVDGQPVVHETDMHRCQQIYFAPAETVIVDGTRDENIFLGRPVPQQGMMQWIVRLCTMEAFWERTSASQQDQVLKPDMLSSGEKQSIGLARALVGDPAILLLDEPTACMTEAAETIFLSSLINDTTRRTIVIASNRESVLKSMDRVITMQNGRIVSDRSGGPYVRDKADHRKMSA